MSTVPPQAPAPVTQPAYPATLIIDSPEGPRNRLTGFFRIFVVIPIAIILGLLTYTYSGSGQDSNNWAWLSAGGILFLPTLLMILFRQKYPKWWFDWNLNITRFMYRVDAFLFLLRDEYPSTDEEQAIHLDFRYPDVKTQLGRGWPIIKWFLAIPHYIVLFFLYIGFIVVWIIAWLAILFTGRYPKGLFDYTVGVMRWSLRVTAYALLLVTDKYPPFSLEP
jgi:hypothetical protein